VTSCSTSSPWSRTPPTPQVPFTSLQLQYKAGRTPDTERCRTFVLSLTKVVVATDAKC
jgi:hypothetical protein